MFCLRNARMIATVQFKRHVTGACVLCIVISKLGHRQEPSLVILFKVDKGLEVALYGTILAHCLTVSLQVKRDK